MMVDTAAGAVVSNVPASITAVPLVAANTARKGLLIVNDSSAGLYVAFDTTASTTHYTVFLPGSAGGTPAYWEMQPNVIYLGQVTGIWTAATGSARCTEL